MMNSLHLVFCTFLILSGCGVTEQEALPAFESYFKAEINGEMWAGDARRSGFTYIEEDTLFQVFASKYDSLLYPYQDKIGFSFFYIKDKIEYSVLRHQDKHQRITGAYYVEKDGDAVIARYFPSDDDINSFTVQINQDEHGRRYAEGTFGLKVVVDPDYDRPKNNQYRQQPDTVLVTNGEYKVLLEE
ncbi:hypothetical protein [Gracilimonas halophila]|uniref:Lipoprotein n=1 Tax=Gracilimonas halophila TaxID=1834464 RepID=A0ABW5JN00_9BACT